MRWNSRLGYFGSRLCLLGSPLRLIEPLVSILDAAALLSSLTGDYLWLLVILELASSSVITVELKELFLSITVDGLFCVLTY